MPVIVSSYMRVVITHRLMFESKNPLKSANLGNVLSANLYQVCSLASVILSVDRESDANISTKTAHCYFISRFSLPFTLFVVQILSPVSNYMRVYFSHIGQCTSVPVDLNRYDLNRC